MIQVQDSKSKGQAQRAEAYRAYAEELRLTAHALRSREARNILRKTAEEYDRMAGAVEKIDERRYADLPHHFTLG